MDTDGSILLLSSEDRLPYKRTKIDKHLHSGFSRNQFTLHQQSWYDEHSITLKTNSRVITLQPAQKIIILEDQTTCTYEKLLLSTGAKPIIPEIMQEQSNLFHVVRSIGEAETAIKMISSVSHVTIIGGGVQGVEMADQVIKAGKGTTLIHRGPTLLNKHFPVAYGKDMVAKFGKAGADIRLHSQIKRVEQSTDKRVLVYIDDQVFKTDLIFVSIGVRPSVELAESAGIHTDNGIVVNANFETSRKNIFAAGDNTRMENGYTTELWHAAEYQGIMAGHSMAGNPVPFDSRIFRLKCEILDSYYFSHNYARSKSLEKHSISNGDVNQTWYVDSGIVKGVVMKNDKPRAKSYEAAVLEGWSIDRALRELSI